MALASARSLSELDHAYAPFKTGSKASLAERARQLGLEPMAMEIMEGTRAGWDLTHLIDSQPTRLPDCLPAGPPNPPAQPPTAGLQATSGWRLPLATRWRT